MNNIMHISTYVIEMVLGLTDGNELKWSNKNITIGKDSFWFTLLIYEINENLPKSS